MTSPTAALSPHAEPIAPLAPIAPSRRPAWTCRVREVVPDRSTAANDVPATGPGRTASALKRGVDVAVAGTALVCLAPALLAVGLAVRLESPGPALFHQTRRGLHGRHIRVRKFRTMRHAPRAGFVQARPGDPRVTRLGRVLRRTSVDELPQLLDVLEGSMSLVGPRPHPLALDDAFVAEVPELPGRYAVRPGITGLAQVSGCRGETPDAAAMRARVGHDLDYVARWSPALELRIVAATLWRGWRDGAAC